MPGKQLMKLHQVNTPFINSVATNGVILMFKKLAIALMLTTAANAENYYEFHAGNAKEVTSFCIDNGAKVYTTTTRDVVGCSVSYKRSGNSISPLPTPSSICMIAYVNTYNSKTIRQIITGLKTKC